MVDALAQAEDSGSRQAALVHFVERVGADEADALRRALAGWKPVMAIGHRLARQRRLEGD